MSDPMMPLPVIEAEPTSVPPAVLLASMLVPSTYAAPGAMAINCSWWAFWMVVEYSDARI